MLFLIKSVIKNKPRRRRRRRSYFLKVVVTNLGQVFTTRDTGGFAGCGLNLRRSMDASRVTWGLVS
jgi:hypothetical protein